jgi:C-terminal processing protease CtpA/Prc
MMRPSLFLVLLGACTSTGLPTKPPPLRDLEEPMALRAEPDDEAARQALPRGSFSGLRVDDARDSLAAKLDQPGALRIVEITENGPAAAAGLAVDDILLEVRVAGGEPRLLQRPSEWRALELATPPGTVLELIVDRAGREAAAKLTLVPRLATPPRAASERIREDERVGVVLRTATEVEARQVGLGPGAGAVVVGLSAASPWRAAGVRFGDLLTLIDGRVVTQPQVVLDTVREPDRDRVLLTLVRGTTTLTVTARLTERAATVTSFAVPLVLSYEATRGRTEWSLLTGLLGFQSTAAAWRIQLLWLVSLGGGDIDELIEVDR